VNAEVGCVQNRELFAGPHRFSDDALYLLADALNRRAANR
jgi:hypothetical protein